MSFSIVLMQSNEPKNKIKKTPTEIMSISGVWRESTSIVNPTFAIQCDIEQISNVNYLFIPPFNRFYFVTNIIAERTNLVSISAHVDVLNTYADAILDLEVITKRQENDWNLYLNDGSFHVYQNSIVLTKAFPSGFSTMNFVLAVAGG